MFCSYCVYDLNNYEISRKKLKQFEESSYCGETTNDEASGRGKKRKYKTQSFLSSDDDNLYDDQISLMQKLLNPPAWTKTKIVTKFIDKNKVLHFLICILPIDLILNISTKHFRYQKQ